MPTQPRDKVLSWASDIEEGTLDQAARSAAMGFVKGHVALMPDAHWGLGATIGSVIPTQGAIMPAAVGVDIGCFRGDTRVPLLDGTQKTLKQMTEAGGEYWVYSLDREGKIVPGRGVAVQTRTNAPLMRLVVSGGEEVFCTPDHQFMLVDGTYREAKDLRFNDSLKPLYRSWQTRDGYESVSTGKGSSRLTHILVHEAITGEALPAGQVVHHQNHNHFDNCPENLLAIDAGEHSRYHRTVGKSFPNHLPEFQQARIAGIQRACQEPARQEQMAAVGSQNIKAYMEGNPEHFRQAVADNGKRGAPVLAAFNTTPRPCKECDHEAANPAALRWHVSGEHGHNHKVISIEMSDETADVYCLQVEKHNNFALAAGVFVHNCGMIAALTDLTSHDLPDNLSTLMPLIERRIPAGVGKSHEWDAIEINVFEELGKPRTELGQKLEHTAISQFGTLGSGNHFVEVCLDETDRVWVVLHSGSRGVGNKLAQRAITEAKGLMKSYFIDLADPDLAYFVQGTPQFDQYIADMLWAQEYASLSRRAMMIMATASLFEVTNKGFVIDEINCHHNFTQREHHLGTDLWITRKGAIKADVGDYGVIPGSMGTRSYIVRGNGVKSSWNSCSHGAGRRMSRSRARKELSVESLNVAMEGKTWNHGSAEELLDEHPDSYKSIDQVMDDQKDLVTIEHTLHQIFNYKGTK